MKLTILETGLLPEGIRADWPSYPEMIETLLRSQGFDGQTQTVSVVGGEDLPAPDGDDPVLLMGSPYGVYDETLWMDPLRTFIQTRADSKRPMVGICFGHQILADALGGRVEKSNKGWGVGRHVYQVLGEGGPLMATPNDTRAFALNVSHQDQVITPPPGAATIAASAFCEHAALLYENAPILSFQGHPEFADDYAAALYTHRRGTTIPADLVDAALASLDGDEDGPRIAGAILRFLAG